MSSGRKYYLPPAVRDLPPEGSIELGNIIASPRSVDQPINYDPPPEIPEKLLLPDVNEPNWSWERDVKLSGTVGIFGSYLQSILGVNVGVKGSASAKKAYSADLTTKAFRPDREYVAKAITADDVQRHLKSRGLLDRGLYMIVGIKIAKNATIAVKTMADMGIYAHIPVDATALGVPGLQFGPDVQGSRAVNDDYGSKEISSPFIFAYQIRKIRLTKKGETTLTDYTRGALYDLDGPGKTADEEEEYLPDGVEDEDPSAEEFDLAKAEAKDELGGEDCEVEVVMPWAPGASNDED